jgi:lipid-binding SYLF domain-containing protein
MIDRRSTLRLAAGATAASLIPLLRASPAMAATVAEAQSVVDQSRIAVQTLMTSPNTNALPRYIQAARAVMIIPQMFEGGFILGATGGNGVMLARLADGSWSYPAFYSCYGGSIGLQIGGQVSQLCLTIMTDRGFQTVQGSEFTVGADISGSIVNQGVGLGAHTAMGMDSDMYAFSLSQGLYAGGTLDGTVINELEDFNDAYYGFGASSRVIFEGRLYNPGAEGLRTILPR